MRHVAPEIRDPLSCGCRRVLSLRAVRQSSSCFLLNHFVLVVKFRCFIPRAKCLERHGKEGLSYGDRFPSQKVLDRGAADAALAWAHAASRLQLRVGPARM